MRQKTADTLLDEAIYSGNLLATMDAVGQGADVIRAGTGGGGKIPTFEALHKTEVLDFIVKTIIDKSRVFEKGALNKEKTQKAIERNLFVTRANAPHAQQSFISRITSAKPDRLAVIWGNLKGIMDINHVYANGQTLMHEAAIFPENLAYLLSEGADINAPNRDGETPVMKMLRLSPGLTNAKAAALLTFYMEHNANVHAVDNKRRGLAFHVLPVHNSGIGTAQQKCIEWALRQGVDFLAKDADDNIPTDHLIDSPRAQSVTYLYAVFDSLANHGYNVDALMQKYASTPQPVSGNITLQYAHRPHIIALHEASEGRKAEVRKQLVAPDPAARLWNPDGSPSRLMLTAFGYGVPEEIFRAPFFRNNLPAARALYKKMEEKLPPQCQEALRTGIDLSFLRDAEQPRQSSAIARALRRKDRDRPPGGERQPGK